MDNSTPSIASHSVNNNSLVDAFTNVSDVLFGRSDGGGGHEPYPTDGGGHEPFATGSGGHEPFSTNAEAPNWFCAEEGRQGLHVAEIAMNYTLVFFIMVMEKFLIHHYRHSKNRYVRILYSEWTARVAGVVIVALAIVFMDWSFDCPQRADHKHSLEKTALASRIVVDGTILLADSIWAIGGKIARYFRDPPEFRVESLKALLAEEKYEQVKESVDKQISQATDDQGFTKIDSMIELLQVLREVPTLKPKANMSQKHNDKNRMEFQIHLKFTDDMPISVVDASAAALVANAPSADTSSITSSSSFGSVIGSLFRLRSAEQIPTASNEVLQGINQKLEQINEKLAHIDGRLPETNEGRGLIIPTDQDRTAQGQASQRVRDDHRSSSSVYASAASNQNPCTDISGEDGQRELFGEGSDGFNTTGGSGHKKGETTESATEHEALEEGQAK